MASVRIDDYNDPRYKVLGELIGTNRFDAIGRLIGVYEYCTDKQTYFVPELILDALAEMKNFVDALIKSDLAVRTDEGIRIKGTKGRIEWLRKLRRNGQKGGRPKKPKDNQPETASEPPPNPLTPTLTLTLTKENTNTCHPDAEELFKTWNQHRGSLPEAKELSKARRTAVLARLKEKPDLSYWEKIVKKLAGSPFCRGEMRGKWRANFDFLIRPDTHIRAMEGQFDDYVPTQINTTPISLEVS